LSLTCHKRNIRTRKCQILAEKPTRPNGTEGALGLECKVGLAPGSLRSAFSELGVG